MSNLSLSKGIQLDIDKITLGENQVVVKNYIYQRNKFQGVHTYWRCRNRNCTGKMMSIQDSYFVTQFHNHPSEEKSVEKIKARNQMKQLLYACPTMQVGEVVDTVLSQLPDYVKSLLPSRDRFASTLTFYKRKYTPVVKRKKFGQKEFIGRYRIEFIETQLGSYQAVLNGYIYQRDRVSSSNTYWKCRNRSCCGRMVLSSKDEAVLTQHHTHPPSESVITELKTRNSMKKLIYKNTDLSANAVVDTVFDNLSDHTTSMLPAKETLACSLAHFKRKIQGGRRDKEFVKQDYDALLYSHRWQDAQQDIANSVEISEITGDSINSLEINVYGRFPVTSDESAGEGDHVNSEGSSENTKYKPTKKLDWKKLSQIVRCVNCGLKANSSTALQCHMLASPECKLRYMCDICGKIMLNLKLLRVHRSSHERDRDQWNDGAIHQCVVCGKITESQKMLDKHLLRHLAKLEYNENEYNDWNQQYESEVV